MTSSVDLPLDRRAIDARSAAELLAASERGVTHLAGAAGSMGALVGRAVSRASGRPVVWITPSLDEARKVAADLSFVLGAREEDDTAQGDVLVATPHEASPYADVGPDRRAAMARLATLFHLAAGLPFRFLVVPAPALVRKVVPRALVRATSTRLVVEELEDRDALVARLSAAGYLRVPIVEDPGSFAVRGGLVDVWPPSADLPVRVDLDGDFVVSMRRFDPSAQRSTDARSKSGDVASLWVPPVREPIATPDGAARAREVVRELCDRVDFPTAKARALVDDVASARGFFGAEGFLPAFHELDPLAAYVPDDALVVLDDPAAVTRALRDELGRAIADEASRGRAPHFPVASLYEDEAAIVGWLNDRRVLALHRTAIAGGAEREDLERFEAAADETPVVPSTDHADLERDAREARQSRGKLSGLDPLVSRLEAWTERGLAVIVATRTLTQEERLTGLLRHRGVACQAKRSRAELGELDASELRGRITVAVGSLARGVVAPAEGLVLLTEEEIFGRRAHRATGRAKKAETRPFLEDLRALAVGDHVVHAEHGVGRYLGLLHRDVGGITVDLLAVEYAGGDKLYLPVYRLNQVQKWSGEGGNPKLDRLGGQTFQKTRSKVEARVRQMADELLKLYAERKSVPGHALAPPDDDYRAFEATFPFDETPDQARAIDEVMADLERPWPMDRLVCGDVGFGKTEVALRAGFRVAAAGRQVAVLCPTTVLAQQHFLSFASRMQDWAIRVALLSRFESAKEQAEVVRALKDGRVDVVIGTHRLLSKDVHFKNLGLLVVDEEQRFGVVHKERIKQLRTNVDALTLTATPIPRTLQMAVGGLRDMSLIATPPVDRRAIRTIVTREDDGVLREALRRELSRGGQVFYVHNRIEAIYEKAAKVQALVPEARIAVAHGQMGEAALEQAMIDFVEGRFDVLFATAIIESGLDIPRANTIVIDRADLFGLAQLYQLRGRVGRARDRAYCYLVVPPASAMSDEARARIEALERHTELGSGFQIASLDLELRGAGDLLGAEQSGSVGAVGFELFCQMLDAAVHELRGEPVVHDVEPELSFDVEALVPEAYVEDVGVRLSLYKRLASAENEAEVDDLAAEMEDRFGPPPDEARRFVRLMRIKTELRRLRALGCEASARGVTLHLANDAPLDARKLTELVAKKGSPYRLTPDMRLSRRMTEHDDVPDGLDAVEKMLVELAPCAKA